MNKEVFSMVEIILGTFFAIIIDIIAAIASFFTLGFLGAVVHAGTWLMFTLWFTIKGVKETSSFVKRYLLPMVVQAIPFIPTTTATFLLTTYVENHPEKFGGKKENEMDNTPTTENLIQDIPQNANALL